MLRLDEIGSGKPHLTAHGGNVSLFNVFLIARKVCYQRLVSLANNCL